MCCQKQNVLTETRHDTLYMLCRAVACIVTTPQAAAWTARSRMGKALHIAAGAVVVASRPARPAT
eukprot:73900-Chlamydomonas_euryale.AAC.1